MAGFGHNTWQPSLKPNTHSVIRRTGNWETEFLESNGKWFKSSLIVIAKASHHKTSMETCLARRQPPKNMAFWVQPCIHYSNVQMGKQWRDTLKEAKLNLTSILFKHYSAIIEAKQCTLQEKVPIISKTKPNEKKP